MDHKRPGGKEGVAAHLVKVVVEPQGEAGVALYRGQVMSGDFSNRKHLPRRGERSSARYRGCDGIGRMVSIDDRVHHLPLGYVTLSDNHATHADRTST